MNKRFVGDDIYLRLLQESDALISYRWRNNPVVWEHTYSRPNCEVTLEMELDWIRKVIHEPNSLRFAICLRENDKYVGNVYLTDIDWERKCGVQGTFIGDPNMWGRGIGTLARLEMHRIVSSQYGIRIVRTGIKCDNERSLRSAIKAGFIETGRIGDEVCLEKTLVPA